MASSDVDIAGYTHIRDRFWSYVPPPVPPLGDLKRQCVAAAAVCILDIFSVWEKFPLMLASAVKTAVSTSNMYMY
jgi:hypothetical protein